MEMPVRFLKLRTEELAGRHFHPNIRTNGFFTDDTGYILGLNSIIKKTTDGGDISEIFIRHDILFIFSILLLILTDSNTGFIGDYGGILKTTDGGSTWSSIPAPSFSDYLLYVTFLIKIPGI